MPYTQEEIDQLNRELYRKKRPGRPSIPLSERKFATSVYVNQHTVEFLVELGGNLSQGIAKAVELLKAQQEASFQAIKAAAERRDQTKVGTDFD